MNTQISNLRVVKSASQVMNYNSNRNSNTSFASTSNYTTTNIGFTSNNAATVDNDMDWYSLFRTSITESIDENPYKLMLEQFQSIPTTSVRTLVAMMIMKESFGWGDTQLFNESRFDIKIRYALGMSGAGSEAPSIFVYNHFRRMITEFEKATGRNLMSETIAQLTTEGSPVFKVGENRLMLWARQVA
ncbi:MAG: transposase [Bacteroidia bacterium]